MERLVKLGSFELDFETGTLTWSEGTYAIFGLPPGSPIDARRALEFYEADVRHDISRCFETAKRSGEPFDLTVRFRSAKGESGWARTIGQVETTGGSSRLVGVIRDITRERDTEERLRLQAYQDVLTGLSNRRGFQAHMEQSLSDPDRVGALALCIVDVDRFKTVNDLHGHAGGDRLLQEVARRLAGAGESTDVVARLGGDEFAVVLHGLRDKAEVRRRLSAMVEAVRPALTIGDVTIEPTVSVGACLMDAKAATVEAMLRQADIALYRAKLNGRDQACLFRPSFRREADGHGRLLDEVGKGLIQQQFEVHYQPIVDLRSHIVRGWEALIRWNHPTKGLLLPGKFMPALSDPNTSVAIDDFVLDTSLRQMRRWLDAGVPVTCAGVNISEAQLKRPDLVTTITTLLQRHGLTPDRLKIEVLETAFLGHSTKGIAATIDRLAELGVVSLLDDFGTGFASLTHLKEFRVERIKIDRSFVANLGVNNFDQAIVRCMIVLGRELGIRVTAEGIETVEQLRILRRFGCDCGQGYLFGRAMHPNEVPGFLTRWHGGEGAALLGDARAGLQQDHGEGVTTLQVA